MSLVPQTSTVTNIEAADRQLRTAIHMFFADADAVSVHTLATAAREIYEKYCVRRGLGGLFDFGPRANIDRRRSLDAMNAARNFFKHPAECVDESIAFDDSFNDSHIYFACTDCAALSPAKYPVEADAFMIWSISTADFEPKFEDVHPEDAAAARSFKAAMDSKLPGLRTAPRELKKRWGVGLLQHVISNPMEAFERPGHTLRHYRQLLLASDSSVLVRLT